MEMEKIIYSEIYLGGNIFLCFTYGWKYKIRNMCGNIEILQYFVAYLLYLSDIEAIQDLHVSEIESDRFWNQDVQCFVQCGGSRWWWGHGET